jgi:hypothetical protein
MLKRKFLLPVIFENDVAELSGCDRRQNTTHILQAVCRRNLQFYRRQWELLESDVSIKMEYKGNAN